MNFIIGTTSGPVHWHTQLRQLEEENQVMGSFFQKMIDVTQGYLYWKNDKGVYLGCNRAMLDFYRFNSTKDIIGKNDAALCPQHATAIEANDRAVMQADEISIFEETVLGSTNRSLKMPLKDAQGNIIGLVGHSVEMGEVQQIKRMLIETREIAEAALMLYKNQLLSFKPDFFF